MERVTKTSTSTSPTNVLTLTQEQRIIAEESPDSKLLVTAGPGTGKTHTLVARLSHLIREHDIAPGQEILVLSFSRFAVREIKGRCREAGGDLAYVFASTFDSFATRLLSAIQPEGPWSQESYDGRIRCAIDLLKSNADAQTHLYGIRHLFVDEIQDLVAERAEFVKSLLETADCGFTLLGDPAQGIYNFQLQGDTRNEGSAALYRWLRKRFAGSLKEFRLSKNHRASTAASKIALWAGPALNDASADYSRLYEGLIDNLNGLRSIGAYKDAAKRLSAVKEQTAVLCRNNGQTLMISREMWGSGTSHVLRRGATDRHLPPWVAATLRGHQMPQIDFNTFSRKVIDLGLGDPASLWGALKRTEADRGKTISLSSLNIRCRHGLVADDLHECRESILTVSTIHRAKGLEFDSVIVTSMQDDEEPDYVGEEARTLYVAMTRPKRALMRIEMPKLKGVMSHERTDRWIRRFGWKSADFEVKPSDMDCIVPPSCVSSGGPSAAEIQDYIATEVSYGDEVYLERVGANDMNPRAVFHLIHDGHIIGKTGDSFAGMLLSVLREAWPKSRLPLRISSLRVEGVETLFGEPAAGRAAGLGVSGSWLSVRAGGLGQLKFREE